MEDLANAWGGVRTRDLILTSQSLSTDYLRTRSTTELPRHLCTTYLLLLYHAYPINCSVPASHQFPKIVQRCLLTGVVITLDSPSPIQDASRGREGGREGGSASLAKLVSPLQMQTVGGREKDTVYQTLTSKDSLYLIAVWHCCPMLS
jgi:hypothetical protein